MKRVSVGTGTPVREAFAVIQRRANGDLGHHGLILEAFEVEMTGFVDRPYVGCSRMTHKCL